MDDMDDLWGRLQLTEEEEADIEITADKMEYVRQKGDLCLIEKLWVDRDGLDLEVELQARFQRSCN